MAKQLILFDLDGTLTDSGPGIMDSAAKALRELGVPEQTEAELRRFVGPPLESTFREFYGFPPEDVPNAIRTFRKYYLAGGIYNNSVYPGIPEMLAALRKAGAKLAVATSKAETAANDVLSHFGLAPYFDLVVGESEAVPGGKKAEIVAETLRQAGCTPENAIMVGDRKHDVLGAAACGVETLGVLYGYAPPGELEAAGAVYIAATVADAQEILLSLLR